MSVQHFHTEASAEQHLAATQCATWRREQAALGAFCDFPGCDLLAELGSWMCEHHVMVRLSSNGSWVDDGHRDGGHG